MALVMEDNDICTNWEEIEENSDILDKQLARLKLEKSKRETTDSILVKNLGNGTDKMLKSNAASIVLDSTTQESLRSGPEPKMTILMRPKESKNSHHHRKSHSDNKSKNASKTLQQREQEYAEARMRILGDVRFDNEETEGTVEAQSTSTTTGTATTTTTSTSNLSPAEILKLKIAEAIRADDDKPATTPTANYNGNSSSSSNTVSSNAGIENNQQHQPHPGRGRNKRSKTKTKIKTMNPEPTRDFPVHKTDSEFIHRHPRGPDGTIGFRNRNIEPQTQ